jgi:hypothetical protein
MYRNLFRDFYMLLTDIQESDSQESLERERFKRQKSTDDGSPLITTSLLPHASIPPADVAFLSESDITKSSRPSTPPSEKPRYPASMVTPTNKRNISDTSFGSLSTDTTPKKLSQLEAKIQSLQNTFVTTIINTLWLGNIDMPWVKGRYMFMTYAP